MSGNKLYLLAECTAKPEHLDAVKRIFSSLLPTVLAEEGCEAMHTTSLAEAPNKLVFFEIFTSEQAHQLHMAQPYTHQLARDLEGKLLEPLKITRLHAF